MRYIRCFLRYLFIALVVFGLYQGGLQLTGNFHEVVPNELYRSRQPGSGDIARYVKKYHIRSVINLRGDDPESAWYNTEIAEAKAAKVQHIDFYMPLKYVLAPQRVQQLITTMEMAPKPLLIHCRSGADRTGLAAALYLVAVKKTPVSVAKRQLWPVYGHVALPWNDTYVMDRMFDTYVRLG